MKTRKTGREVGLAGTGDMEGGDLVGDRQGRPDLNTVEPPPTTFLCYRVDQSWLRIFHPAMHAFLYTASAGVTLLLLSDGIEHSAYTSIPSTTSNSKNQKVVCGRHLTTEVHLLLKLETGYHERLYLYIDRLQAGEEITQAVTTPRT